jgi:hypothetical protein
MMRELNLTPRRVQTTMYRNSPHTDARPIPGNPGNGGSQI